MLDDNISLIRLQNVTKKYGSREILRNVSINIKPGEFIVIRGSNGSGKSTLLKIISGLIPFNSGQRLTKHPQFLIGYTPDRLPQLRMTSTEYLTHMGKLSKLSGYKLQERITELHRLFHLEQSKSLKMTAFSKGMLQKLNIMQAMLTTPDLLVLDEPFSGLDKQSVDDLVASLQKINEEGTAILAAVHDPLLVSRFSVRTFWIQKGLLEEKGSEELQEQWKVCFEITVSMNKQAAEQLIKAFSDVNYALDERNFVKFTVSKKEYRNFLLELIERDIELISLQRKEH